MPHPDDRVEWELWTSSADPKSETFKDKFGHVSEALGTHAQFNPHMMIIDGRLFGCTQPSKPCGNQCTNSGRYCHEDPENDLQSGVSGVHIVQENLRQMCIWEQANATKSTAKWWTYQNLFSEHCAEYNEQATNAPGDPYYKPDNFNKACSERQQTAAGLDVAVTVKMVCDELVTPCLRCRSREHV